MALVDDIHVLKCLILRHVLYKSENIVTLVTIWYIVGFIVSMYYEYRLWVQVAVLLIGLDILDILDILHCLGQVYACLYMGRAPRTKETLPDFRKKCWVTRHSQVFREFTGSQRTPGFGASQLSIKAKVNDYLGSSVGVSISLVLIPASQLGIKA